MVNISFFYNNQKVSANKLPFEILKIILEFLKSEPKFSIK